MASDQFKNRVKYHCSLNFEPEEDSFTIVDECDKQIYETSSIFKDKFSKIKWIGFTGTAVAVTDDGNATNDLVEEKQLKLLEVDVFYG